MDIREQMCDLIFEFEEEGANDREISWAINYLQKLRNSEPKKDFKKVK